MTTSVSILGAGRMGRRHIQAARELGMDLVGVYDVSQDSLQLARNDLAVPDAQLYDDVDRLYREARPECVIVATTADSHCELVCMAAERGARYVLVEKPMAVSLKECDRMIETCARTGTRLAVNHQMRFMDQYTEPRRLIATGAYGEFGSMTVVGGNFGLAMVGSHYFEAFRLVAGEDISEVTAWFSPEVVPNPRGARFEDRAGSVRAVTPSGKRLYLEAGSDQGHGIRVIYACRTGMITVDGLRGQMESSAREAQYLDLPTTRYGMPAVTDSRAIPPADVVGATAALLRALLDDADNVSGDDGRRAVEALVAAHESAERGNVPVAVDSGLDRARVYPWA